MSNSRGLPIFFILKSYDLDSEGSLRYLFSERYISRGWELDRYQAMSLFVAVADSSSFAEAARRFDISPPAVTRVIAALEERLAT